MDCYFQLILQVWTLLWVGVCNVSDDELRMVFPKKYDNSRGFLTSNLAEDLTDEKTDSSSKSDIDSDMFLMEDNNTTGVKAKFKSIQEDVCVEKHQRLKTVGINFTNV